MVDRLKPWAERHVLLVDVLRGLPWCVLAVLEPTVLPLSPTRSILRYVMIAVMWLGLSLARTRPVWSIVALAVTCVAHIALLDEWSLVASVSALAAAYGSQARLASRGRIIVLIALAAGTLWAAVDYSRDVLNLALLQRWPAVLLQWMAVALFALLGTLARRRREEQRTSERRHQQELRLAAMAERTHIAREMHDVVAHSLGVIVAQADGGRYAAATNPAAAVGSLETISQVGRDSLAEMRELLRVLRTDDGRDLSPAPGPEDLSALIQDYRRTGLDAHLVSTGEAPELPRTTALTVYRIVQEALANVLKHAGRCTAEITLTWAPDSIEIEVVNPLPGQPPAERPDGPGHGLVGMRERVELHGGELIVGPQTGCWRVHARLPLRSTGAP